MTHPSLTIVTPTPHGPPGKPDELAGASRGQAITQARIIAVHPYLSGRADGAAFCTAYFKIAADWLCTVKVPGAPVHERSDMPESEVALCHACRIGRDVFKVLVRSMPIAQVGVPMWCVVHDPHFIPFNPDRP
jgi:hypothetical protein